MKPPVPLSTLRRQRDEKRLAFRMSRSSFKATLRRKTRPFTILKEHPKAVLGTLFSLLTATEASRRLLKGNQWLFRAVKARWLWSLARLGGSAVVKLAAPFFAGGLKNVINRAWQSMDGHEAN